MKNIKLFENFKDKDDYLTILKDEFINFLDKDSLDIYYDKEKDQYTLCFTTNCIDRTSLETYYRSAESIISEYRNINNQLKIFERDFPNFKRFYFKITDNTPPWAYIEVYYKVIIEQKDYKYFTLINDNNIILKRNEIYKDLLDGMHPNLCKIWTDNRYIDAHFKIQFSDGTMTLSELNKVAAKLIKNITIDGEEIFKIFNIAIKNYSQNINPMIELSLKDETYILSCL